MTINYETYRDNKECHSNHPSVRLRNKFIIDTLASKKFKTLIDAGCGDGYLLQLVKEYHPSAHYTGIDYSSAVLEKNKQMFPEMNFYQGDLGSHSVKLPPSADVVVCSEVIEHIQDRKQVVDNLCKCVNPGGTVILTTQASKRYLSDIENGHLKHFTISELRGAFEDKGMKVIKAYRKGFPFYDLQKMLHSLFYKSATNIQMGKGSFLKNSLFRLAYRSFLLTPRSQYLGTQIFMIIQRPLSGE